VPLQRQPLGQPLAQLLAQRLWRLLLPSLMSLPSLVWLPSLPPRVISWALQPPWPGPLRPTPW
jgi:hypothetical protein